MTPASPYEASLRKQRQEIARYGKWVVKWDFPLPVLERGMHYLVLGASHGRVFVASSYVVNGALDFEALYQLPLDWHGETYADFRPARGKDFIGDRQAVVEALRARAHQYAHIVGDYQRGQRTFDVWQNPPAGHYWSWRTQHSHQRLNPLTSALRCAFQHPRETRHERVPCKHCPYPYDSAARISPVDDG